MSSSTLKSILYHIHEGQKKGESPEIKIKVGSSEATFILDSFNTNNRKKKRFKIASYAQDIKTGRWKSGTGENIKFGKDGRLIDGQNRLYAVIEADTPQEFTFKFGLNPDVQDVLDTGAPRTVADTMAMHDIKYAQRIAAMTTTLASFLRNAHKPYSHNANHPSTKSELDEIGLDNAEDLSESLEAVRKLGFDKVVPESYAGFCHFILRHTSHAHLVPEFFEKLAIGANMGADDPVFVVHKRLIMDKPFFRPQKNKDYTLALIFKGWNLFINDQKITNKMRTPDQIPVIEGLEEVCGIRIY